MADVVKPGWKRKSFAAFIAILAIFNMAVGALSDRVIGVSVLLFAIDFAYIPSPPLNLTPGEIYAMARQGWRAPWISKILGAAGFVFLACGFYLKWLGR